MAELLHYRSPRERLETTASLGMKVFLASWSMTFGSLFFAYGVLRLHAASWPPEGSPLLPIFLPALNTALLIASSLVLQLGLARIRKGKVSELTACLSATLLLGALFLTLQILIWIRLYDLGLRPEGGPYPSTFYALTIFHGLHVLIGLVALAVLLFRSMQGVYSAPRHLAIRLWTSYWHFVGAVWVLMFALVYIA